MKEDFKTHRAHRWHFQSSEIHFKVNKILILFSIALMSQLAVAQKLSVRGQLTDSLSNPLPSATVMILLAKDSSLVNFGATNVNGFFEIKNVVRAESFQGLLSRLCPFDTKNISARWSIGSQPGTNPLADADKTTQRSDHSGRKSACGSKKRYD